MDLPHFIYPFIGWQMTLAFEMPKSFLWALPQLIIHCYDYFYFSLIMEVCFLAEEMSTIQI